jgi:hypothetical protein
LDNCKKNDEANCVFAGKARSTTSSSHFHRAENIPAMQFSKQIAAAGDLSNLNFAL